MSVVFKRLAPYTKHAVRWHCASKKTYKCKLLVVGGGAGGCSIAWRFSRRMRKNCIILLEPSKIHYYQPAFTLVGAGVKTLKQTYRPVSKLLPRGVTWIHSRAEGFDPCNNLVCTCNGDKIYYEFMVVAVGIKNDYDKGKDYNEKESFRPNSYFSGTSVPVTDRLELLGMEFFQSGFQKFFIMRTAKEWNSLPASVFPNAYNPNLFKVRVNTGFLWILGLQKALDDPRSPVSTIFSPYYCTKTWSNIQKFTGGHALFTFPVVGGKCSGAAVKIMFLAYDHWRKQKIINKTSITYNTGADAIFGVPKYATALRRLALNRYIVPNYGADLVEVTPNGAVFVGSRGEAISFPYKMLHVCPPMSPPHCLMQCEELSNSAGYLDVDQYTLQHKRFPNVFGLGDCTCTPNSKTAAAVGPQSYVVERNLSNAMAGRKPSTKYNGYGACTLITSYKKGIIAEFVYDKKLAETFPFDQSKERRLFYQLNKRVFPYLYWNRLLKGKWNGPATIRNIINPLRL